MLNAGALLDSPTATRQGLGFSLTADGTLYLLEPGEPRTELGRLEGRQLLLGERLLTTTMLSADEGDGCELLLDGEVLRTSSRGFKLNVHRDPSGMSLVDLDGNKPIYHSYGDVWRPYAHEDKWRPELATDALELRSKHYLAALIGCSGSRLRPSGLASSPSIGRLTPDHSLTIIGL